MATLVAKSNTYDGRYLKLTITQVKNVAENTSELEWVLSSEGGNANYYSISKTTIKINGEQVYYKNSTPYNTYVFPAKKGSVSGSITVAHDSDGSLTVPVVFSTGVYDGSITDYGGSFVLDRIERASAVACTNADIGTAPIITINSGAEAFRHTLRYSFGSLSGTIVEKTGLTVYVGWVIPQSFYGEIPNSKTGTGTIYCDTYNGDTLFGTESCEFTATASYESSAPLIDPIIADSNERTSALTGDDGVLVRYCSTASVSIGAQARSGATIASQTAKNGGKSLPGPSCEFPGVEFPAFVVSAVDSRGLSVSIDCDLSGQNRWIDYIKLTCNQEENKQDASGTMSLRCSGNYFNGTFGAQSNSLSVQYRYRPTGGSYGIDWTDMDVTVDGNTYTAAASIAGLDYHLVYIIETRAVDSLMEAVATTTATKAIPVFDWGDDGFNFNVPVSINNKVTLAIGENGELILMPNLGSQMVLSTDGSLAVAGDLTVGGIKITPSPEWADYIESLYVEEMESGESYTVEKWASGKAVCYGGKSLGSVSFPQGWSGSMYLSRIMTIAFPTTLFVAAPDYLNISVMSSSGNLIVAPENSNISKDTTGNFRLCRTSSSVSNVKLGIHAIGKWK